MRNENARIANGFSPKPRTSPWGGRPSVFAWMERVCGEWRCRRWIADARVPRFCGGGVNVAAAGGVVMEMGLGV